MPVALETTEAEQNRQGKDYDLLFSKDLKVFRSHTYPRNSYI